MRTRVKPGKAARSEAFRKRKLRPAPKCRECGCTDEDCRGCIERTGERCSWVETDLCSACAPVPSVHEIGGFG